MRYWVTYNGQRWPSWLRVMQAGMTGKRWSLSNAFPVTESAIDAARGFLRDNPSTSYVIRVEDEKGVVIFGPPIEQGSTTMSERTAVTDLGQPLNIKRQDLIDRLQANLDAETKKRSDLAAREGAARADVQQFVTDHQAEIVQWIGAGAPGGFGSGSWEDIAKNMARFFEDNDYTPSSAQKSQRETDLEKFVRVLTMATDDTVEVTPQQQIYNLL